MSIEQYNSGLANLAQNEASGEDITDDIERFARVANVDSDMIRHEVTEMAQNVE